MKDALHPVWLAGDESRPPVVLLHGFMGNAHDWKPVAETLGETHHVLGVNLPGHGPGWTADQTAAMDFASCAAAIEAHLEAMGRAPAAFLGYSMGGRLALYLAMRHPGAVSRLILESSSPGLDTEEKRTLRATRDRDLADRLANLRTGSEEFRAFLDEWYAMPLFASLQRHPDKLAALIETRAATCDPALLAAALRALGTGAQPNLWPDLHALKTPTLAITGQDDRKFRIIAEDMALASPAIATEILTGCGHNVHLECPAAFMTVVRAFLNPTR